MTVRELNEYQLLELKVKYLFERFENYGTTPSYRDIAASEGIPNGLIFVEYDGIDFIEEDFACRDEEPSMDEQIAILTNKWYDDCLQYNIPLSPSDVEDTVRDLFTLKKEKEEWEEN